MPCPHEGERVNLHSSYWELTLACRIGFSYWMITNLLLNQLVAQGYVSENGTENI